jgi:multiple sugar transport system substrate-binding protein
MLPPVVLLLLLAALLAGCAKPPQPPKPAFKGTLTLWAAPGLAGFPAGKPDQSWYEEQVKRFELSHQGVTMETRFFTSPAALEEALLSGKEGQPDLAFSRPLAPLTPKLANVGTLMDPKERDDYLPGALAAFRGGEAVVGIPVLVETQVLALRDQDFADAGAALPEGGNWTLNEFEDRASKLSGPGHFALGFYHLPGYHEWWPLASGLITGTGGIADGAQEGLARLVAYRKEGLLHPDTAKVKAEESWAQFARGEYAIMPVSSWAIPTLRGAPYNLKFSVAGFPGGITSGYAYGWLLFQQADDLKLQAAAALARSMTAPDQQVRLARETGLMPARKSAGNPFKDDPQLTRAYELSGQFVPLPASPAWDLAEQQFSQELRYALLGAKAPNEALTSVWETIKAVITPAAK